MAALLVALLPLIGSLLGGSSVATVLAALSAAQWRAIAAAMLQAMAQAPAVVTQLAAMHVALGALLDNLRTSGDPTQAAGAARNWLAANGEAAITLQSAQD